MVYFPLIYRQFYRFKRPFLEVEGYSIKENKDGTDSVLINALGIEPGDLKIEVEQEYSAGSQLIKIFAESKDEFFEEEYSLNLVLHTTKPVKKIFKSFHSGLLHLKIEYDKPSRPNFEVVDA